MRPPLIHAVFPAARSAMPSRTTGFLSPGLRIALRHDCGNRRRELLEGHLVHALLVGPEKRDRLRVVRPPVARLLVVEDLLPVDPRERPVQDRRASVGGQAGLLLRREVVDPEVVAADEGDLLPVRRQARDGLLLGRAGHAFEAAEARSRRKRSSERT